VCQQIHDYTGVTQTALTELGLSDNHGSVIILCCDDATIVI